MAPDFVLDRMAVALGWGVDFTADVAPDLRADLIAALEAAVTPVRWCAIRM